MADARGNSVHGSKLRTEGVTVLFRRMPKCTQTVVIAILIAERIKWAQYQK